MCRWTINTAAYYELLFASHWYNMPSVQTIEIIFDKFSTDIISVYLVNYLQSKAKLSVIGTVIDVHD